MQETNQRRDVISAEPGEPVERAANKRSLMHACLCAKVADEYRGQDTIVLDLTAVTPIVDYFVVTTANSKRQMHAIADETDRVLAAEGSRRLGREGYDNSSTWLLLDFGDVVLHVFVPETREIYDLEHLWADAKQIDYEKVSKK